MEVDQIRHELKSVDGKVNALDQKFDAIEKKADTILAILTGTEYDTTIGLINRFGQFISNMEKLEKKIYEFKKEQDDRILKIEKWKDKISYISIGISLAAGGGLWAAIQAVLGKH